MLNLHKYSRLLNRLALALLALTLVTGTVACFDSGTPVFPEEIDDDSGSDNPDDSNDTGGGGT